MPLRPARVGRVGVIGAPVAKTAVIAAAVTPRVSRAAASPAGRLPACSRWARSISQPACAASASGQNTRC